MLPDAFTSSSLHLPLALLVLALPDRVELRAELEHPDQLGHPSFSCS
jgi:hypothetical protein